ncbi:MAG: division/cell wall cluster transcriptional repressor MraZ [Solobacterium sp.]|nr:division/cell wall cluster transcriptional repressor MraZ [Solobacterium sp.]
MFIGKYTHSIDSKNRLIIPVKFRDDLGDSFVVTRWLDGCLSIYSMSQWEKMIEGLSALPATKKNVRLYIRSLTANAIECSLDNQGRIQLSKDLVDIAKIQKSCVITGVNDHIEIWAEEQYNSYSEADPTSFEDAAESISDIGLL